MIKIKRTEESEYKLEINGKIVETYQKTKMSHPEDWQDDAMSAGASQLDISNRNWIYSDLTQE